MTIVVNGEEPTHGPRWPRAWFRVALGSDVTHFPALHRAAGMGFANPPRMLRRSIDDGRHDFLVLAYALATLDG